MKYQLNEIYITDEGRAESRTSKRCLRGYQTPFAPCTLRTKYALKLLNFRLMVLRVLFENIEPINAQLFEMMAINLYAPLINSLYFESYMDISVF